MIENPYITPYVVWPPPSSLLPTGFEKHNSGLGKERKEKKTLCPPRVYCASHIQVVGFQNLKTETYVFAYQFLIRALHVFSEGGALRH